MSKPDDIPQDVWDAAQGQCVGFEGHHHENEIVSTVARAILAERERCAKVADQYSNFVVDSDFGAGYKQAALNIDAAIRKGGE